MFLHRLRRRHLIAGAGLGGLALTFAVRRERPAEARMSPTPSCDDDIGTPKQTEGPYFTPGSPLRPSLLEPGLAGTPLVVAGTVLTTGCRPVGRALLDFWHADAEGEYDLAGYRCRGHQFTDGEGRYRLTTVLPGLYPGRTRHIHVKVQAPDGPVLSTQLYFPNEAKNRRDGLFDPVLLLAMDEGAEEGRYDFVVDDGRPS